MRLRQAVGTALSFWMLAFLQACEGPEARSAISSITLADSAGIQILQVPAAVLEDLPIRRLQAEASLVIGALDGPDEMMLGYVTDATQLSDGSIVIADAQQDQLLVFDDGGSFRNRIGGPGEGPGEFRSPQSVAVVGDTLYVHSQSLVSRFLADGTFLDSRPALLSVGLQMGLKWMEPIGWQVPILYWTTRNPYPRNVPEGDGPHDILMHLAVADASGGTYLDILDATPGYWLRLTSAQRSFAADQGLEGYTVGNVVHHPLEPDIHGTFVVEGPVLGRSNGSGLEFRDSTGRTRTLARYLLDSEFEVDDERLLEWLVNLGVPEDGPILRRAWDGLPRPADPAQFFDLRTGRQNHVWIATRPEPSEQGVPWTRWLRVRVDGRPVEWIISPPVEVLELGPEGVLGLSVGDLGVHRVARYDFR